jgi:predicted RNase H-like nuclease
VVLGGSDVRVLTARTFSEIAALDVGVIGVDIPIGVPEAAACRCSRPKVVGPRASSVCVTPPRAALEAPTFAEAVERARAAMGKGISQQSYALRHRILEVDSFAEANERMIEVHPDVSFTELASGWARGIHEIYDSFRALEAGLESEKVGVARSAVFRADFPSTGGSLPERTLLPPVRRGTRF